MLTTTVSSNTYILQLEKDTIRRSHQPFTVRKCNGAILTIHIQHMAETTIIQRCTQYSLLGTEPKRGREGEREYAGRDRVYCPRK
jgi:hypothetical protein